MIFAPRTVKGVLKQFHKTIKHLDRLDRMHTAEAARAYEQHVRSRAEATAASRVKEKLKDLVA